jgi:hypothetical protein
MKMQNHHSKLCACFRIQKMVLYLGKIIYNLIITFNNHIVEKD